MKSPLDIFWGTTIAAIELTPDLADMELSVSIHDATRVPTKQVHTISLVGIYSLQFDRTTLLPWTYCELTSVEVRRRANGLEFLAELWGSEDTLKVLCGSVLVDGISLEVRYAV